MPEILVPAVLPGRSVDLEAFLAGWVGEVLNTFFLVYAFGTPVGAILTRHLLIEETHRVPRILAVVALVSVALGVLA